MTSPTDILHSIPENRSARVFLPLIDRKERFRLNGVYHREDPPRFTLTFKSGMLPPFDRIDMATTAIITIDMGGPALSLEAKALEMVDERALLMVAVKSFSHEQMREFFRVDAVTGVISSSFGSEALSEDSPSRWRMSGRTIDISGSGVLATFGQKPPDEPQARLEISLPTSNREKITVLAHPVRIVEAQPGLYEVAYHFDEINQEDRDKIIGCCLVIQRQMLRLQAQTRNATIL
ncbi:MAG: PilZ domain-containing protein [Desulfobulbaceae bacterium]|nr:PilZ domain-containing protein [Desulfobulbaceae bacterium]